MFFGQSKFGVCESGQPVGFEWVLDFSDRSALSLFLPADVCQGLLFKGVVLVADEICQ